MAQVLPDALRIELGLGSTPLTALASVTWTDVTSSVLLATGVSFNRGRQGQDTSARPGSLSFALDNSQQKGLAGRWTLGHANQTAGLALRIPVRVRTAAVNLVPNPTFTTNTTGWINVNSTIARITTDAYGGSGACLEVTRQAGTGSGPFVSNLGAVTANTTYTWAAWVKVPTGNNPVTLAAAIDWKNGAASISTSRGSDTTITSADGWTRVYVTATAPATVSGTQYPTLYTRTSGTAGQKFLVDAAMFHAGDQPSNLWDLTAANDLWYGYVETLTSDWENGYRPVVRVTASDRLARFERRTLVSSLMTAEQISDSSDGVWPLDDDAAATSLTSRTGASVPNLAITSLGTPSSSNPYALGSDADGLGPDGIGSCLVVNRASSTNGHYLRAPNIRYSFLAGVEFTLDCYFYVGASGTQMGLMYLADASVQVGMYVTSGNKLAAEDTWEGVTITGATTVTAGSWHHAALVQRIGLFGAREMELWLDGVSQGTQSLSGYNFTFTGTDLYVGARVSSGGSPVVYDLVSGRLSGASYTAAELSSSRILERAKGRTGFSGDTAGTRFQRLCRAAGMASADYSVSGTTVATMIPQPVVGRTVSDVANEVATAEAGAVYLDRSGDLVLAARGVRYNATSSFSVPATVIDQGVSISADLSFLVNDATASRPGGITERVVNAASVAAYDTHDKSVVLYVDTDAQVTSAANYLANSQATPAPRTDSISVDLVTAAASVSVSDLLTAEVGTRFTVTSTPDTWVAATTFFVEGVADQVSATGWQRSMTVSPVSSGTVWVLGDATYSVLGVTTILAY